jgi:hypothetical protein
MSRHPRMHVLAGVLALVSILLAGACSDDDGDEPAGGDTTATTPTATATETTATTATTDGGATSTSTGGSATTAPGPAGDGCTGTAPPVPEGAARGEVVDLDGDGRADEAWMAADPDGTRRMGVVTAAGGGSVVTVESASPQPLTLLAVDADEAPPVELFVSDGRTAQLWAFADCAIAPVTNPEGEQYLFDLGFRGTGTGIGCRDTDEGRQLVGLNVLDDDGTTVSWSRTVIERDGLEAANGATDEGTFTHGDDDAAIDLLHDISCGDLTIDADGIRQPPL